MEFAVGSVCDRGLSHKRPVNEDRALVRADAGLFVVCDGVGGHSSGEVASQLAIDTIEEALAHHDGGDIEELLENAVQYANRDIFEMAASDPRYFGMGTTIALLYLDRRSGRAIIGHAGDSRVYRYDTALHRETYDHTDLDDALRAGRLSPQQATRLGKQNTINRALGIESDVVAEFKSISFVEGDAFLLCSDGVTRHVGDDELAELFDSGLSPDALCEEIRSRCYARGAEDNLTAVVVSTAAQPAATRSPLEIPMTRGASTRNALAESDVANGRASSRVLQLVAVLGTLAIIALVFYLGRASTFLFAPSRQPLSPAAAARDAFERGEYALAWSSFEQLARDDPERSDYQLWLGRTALAQGRAREAIDHLERSVALGAPTPETYLYLAAALQMDQRDKEAAEALKKFADIEGSGAASGAEPASNRAPSR